MFDMCPEWVFFQSCTDGNMFKIDFPTRCHRSSTLMHFVLDYGRRKPDASLLNLRTPSELRHHLGHTRDSLAQESALAEYLTMQQSFRLTSCSYGSSAKLRRVSRGIKGEPPAHHSDSQVIEADQHSSHYNPLRKAHCRSTRLLLRVVHITITASISIHDLSLNLNQAHTSQ